MKLAFCLFNYFAYGGLQRDFLRIAKECVKRGHQVQVYTMRWEGEFDPEIAVTIVPSSGWQNHSRLQHFADAVLNMIKTQNIDLVVGFNKMPGLDIYYAADTCYQAKSKKKHGFFYRLLPRYRQLVRYENAVFSEQSKTEILMISEQQQPEFIKYYGTQTQRFHLLPPGIAKDRIAPSNASEIRNPLRAELGLDDNHFLLLMVGSGFKTKGLDRSIEGLAALPPHIRKRAQLYVIGKDNPAPFLQLAKKLQINEQIHFLGGRDDIPRFLLAADLLLHPAYNENTGTVLLEAVVSGLPVLTTDICGYAHYILEGKAGQVLPSPFQQKQFNQALESMLLSPERAAWAANGIAFAKQADLYSMPERAVDIIESLRCKWL